MVVWTLQRYWESAPPRSNRAICSIDGNDCITGSKYHATIPSNSRCRLWQRSIADPCVPAEPYWFSHRLPGTARNAAKSEAKRLAKRITEVRSIGEGRKRRLQRRFVHLVDEDTQQSSGFVVRIGLESGIDLNDECGCDSVGKTGLDVAVTTSLEKAARDSRR